MRYYPVRYRRHADAAYRRRVMDSAVRHLKYNDGIKDIADKIKGKISEAINAFKSLPGGKKVVFLLSSLASAVTLVFAAKGTSDLVKILKDVKESKAGLERAYETYSQWNPGADREAFGASSYGSDKTSIVNVKEIFAKAALLKVVIALAGSLIAMISAKLAIAKKQVAEGEDESRVVAEVMTR